MESIVESLSTPVAGRYDVIVCGGGPAGVGAAVAAARAGAKTLLIEQYGYLGGMWTAGLVNPFFDQEEKGGLVRELVDRLKAREAWGAFWDICFDYETMKLLLDELCGEAGVEVLFHTVFCRPLMEGDRVTGVVVENKSGRQAYLADVVVDATGDGDVAARAGAEIRIGRDTDGAVQPMTMMFLLGNIHFYQEDAYDLYNMMKEAVETHHLDYQIPFQRPFIIQLPVGRYAVVQLTHIRGRSGVDARDLSAAEQEGRRMAMDAFQVMKRYIPAFRDIDLVATAAQVGVRESRRVMGEYLLTRRDVQAGAVFPDGILSARFGIDIHNPGDDTQQSYDVRPYQIPFRCLIPRGLRGLLVAGRCISGDFEAHASYRVTGDCLAMGEAAGCGAAMAAKAGIDVRDIDIPRLREAIGFTG